MSDTTGAKHDASLGLTDAKWEAIRMSLDKLEQRNVEGGIERRLAAATHSSSDATTALQLTPVLIASIGILVATPRGDGDLRALIPLALVAASILVAIIIHAVVGVKQLARDAARAVTEHRIEMAKAESSAHAITRIGDLESAFQARYASRDDI